MKKAISIFLGATFVLTSLGISNVVQANVLSTGIKSDEVKAVQEILKEDSSVYPEGYTTGYYGPLTTKAVKQLQEKFKIPETGQIDSVTSQLLFPNLKVMVLSPNGGETWNRKDIQTIKWTVAMPLSEEAPKEEKYFRPRASIDLFRKVDIATPCLTDDCKTAKKSIFVKHIATVNLFDMAYSWKIPNSISNSNDYVIRISTGRRIVPLLLEKSDTEIQDVWRVEKDIYWDESDGAFTITGTTVDDYTPSLAEVIKILESMVKELNRAIQLLKKI